MNNPPAFPTSNWQKIAPMASGYNEGMTLRDYFAAQAMSSIMPAVMGELKKTRGSVKEAIKLQALSAETCYALADEMMKARDE